MMQMGFKVIKYKNSPLFVFLLRFLAVLFLFTLSRIVFYLFNLPLFPGASPFLFLYGLRFDVSIVFYANLLYFVTMLIPARFITHRWYRKTADIYFVTINSLAILLNLIDTCYYPFSMRRMTFDIFQFVGETNNFAELIPAFLRSYYYMIFILLGFIALLIGVVYFTNKIDYKCFMGKSWNLILGIVLRFIIAFAIFTGMRGGWQYRPINIMVAGTVGGAENAALVLNSPFSLFSTVNSERIEKETYFQDETECAKYFTPNKQIFNNEYFKFPETKNVVIIILEGISTEYSAFLSGSGPISGYTPFLDSLAQHGMVFKGFANGQQSIEALSSILGGIPSLMSKPFTQSQYSNNSVDYAIPIIEKKGLKTAFFHGGKNGTMGFDNYCQLLGIDQYYGMNEYPNVEEDFDGTWGIADVPYLQYVAKTLSTYSQPFFATIFTLSSHHPFIVPAQYDHKLPKGNFPMQHVVAYTDKALQEFFKKASQTQWFQNTLFVITADHTNFDGADNVDYQKHRYSVPMIFYHPQFNNSLFSDKIMQQTDIMPSIFAFCGWTEPFVSFGNNVFDNSQNSFAIIYSSAMYKFYVDHWLIEFDGQKICYIWDLSQKVPRSPVSPRSDMRFLTYEKTLKAVIQQFNNRLLENRLRVE